MAYYIDALSLFSSPMLYAVLEATYALKELNSVAACSLTSDLINNG